MIRPDDERSPEQILTEVLGEVDDRQQLLSGGAVVELVLVQ